MRVSPVGFAFDTEETVLVEAKRSAEVTHNHPEGIKGAQSMDFAGRGQI
jgi:ADP-ribosylglycohydrolase